VAFFAGKPASGSAEMPAYVSAPEDLEKAWILATEAYGAKVAR
jgi:hypothetical protein